MLLLAAGCTPVEVHFSADPGLEGVRPRDPLYVPAAVTERGARTCPRPHLRAKDGPFVRRVLPTAETSRAFLWSGGVLVGDLDGDEVIDLVSPSESGVDWYVGGGDGTMEAWSLPQGPADTEFGSGGSLADWDADGDLDVLLLRWNRSNVLLRNDGAGHFVDVTAQAGLGARAASTASAWGDLDRDGDLDLFVGSYDDVSGSGVVGGSYLYENVGGSFVHRPEWLPASLDVAYTRAAGFHDVDGDGYPELYVVNDMGSVQPNLLLRNRQGRLVPDGGVSGLDLEMSGGGLGVGDVNRDGRPDMLIPQWGRLSLMLSDGAGRWVDWADALGLVASAERGQAVGWGAELADIDNDGALDAVVAYGHLEVDLDGWDNPAHQPDALFLQQPDGHFVDVAPEWGVDDAGSQRGFGVADLNRDGWLDLVKRDLSGPDVVYLSRCGAAHWLMVSLEQLGSQNRFGVGASVRITAGDEVWTRTVTAGGTGFGSGGPPEVHVGLGALERVDRVEVWWPDGATTLVGTDLPVDREFHVLRE